MSRRLQFSLRALLVAVMVVAVSCAWIGSNAILVRQRKAMIQGDVNGVWGVQRIRNPPEPIELPWIRRVFGDYPVMEIHCMPPGAIASGVRSKLTGVVDHALVVRIRRLFREATIYLPDGKEWRPGCAQPGDYSVEWLWKISHSPPQG